MGFLVPSIPFERTLVMAGKHITLAQLERLALRGKADALAQVIKALEAIKNIGITVTLPAADWNGGELTVKHEVFLADSSYWYFVCGNIDVDADDITVDGQITFRCRDALSADLTVSIIRLEVEADDESNAGKVFNLIANEDLKDYIDRRFSDFYNAFLTEQPIYFSLCDSDNKTIQDSDNIDLTGLVIFQVK